MNFNLSSVVSTMSDSITFAKAAGIAPSPAVLMTADAIVLQSLTDGAVVTSSNLAQKLPAAELSMIELQSIVSQRANSQQMMTNFLASLQEGMKTVAGNIGR